MTANEFRTLIEGYEGVITEDEDDVRITANNVITGYYQNGKVWRRRKVECIAGYSKEMNTLFGEEKTYEILGGELGSAPDMEQAKRILDKFCFRRKQGYEQMSLF